MSVKQRVLHALAANAFGQVVTVLSQLLLTPLFFRYWGAGLYGEWLLLSSIPSYLTMADLGIGSAAGNEMTMRAGGADYMGAQQTFRGALWVASMAGALALGLGLLLAMLASQLHMPRTELLQAGDASSILLMLSCSVALGFWGGVVSAGFRAAGRNALGISLANGARLLEALGMASALLLDQGALALCGLALAIKAVTLAIQYFTLRRLCTWLVYPKAPADRTLARRLIAPSLAFVAFPLGNALALQGPILIIGHVLGAPAVAMFSTMRTLARLPIQIANAFNSSVWPEMSRAHGAGDAQLLRRLHRSTWCLTLVPVVVCGFGLAYLGEWIAHYWLGSGAGYKPLVLNALVLITVLSAIWNASSVVLSATNTHAGLSVRYVLANGLCMGLAWLLTPSLQWYGLLTSLLLAEVLLLVWVLPRVLRQTQDDFPAFLRGSIVDGMRAAMARLRMRLA